MGVLFDRLQKQLQDREAKKDAEECIVIYNFLKKTDKKGCIWSSTWGLLVHTKFKGFPSNERTYHLTNIGKGLLKGIEKETLKT